MSSIAFTAPHHEATKAGQAILEQGGTAIEAMVAAAATIAVVYPHMNGLGGDGFWLISEPGKTPIGIDASGKAAQRATLDFYAGDDVIPTRGGKAAVTMAGAVAGWQKALDISAFWQSPKSLNELLKNAIDHAKNGIEITESLQSASRKVHDDLAILPGFSQFLDHGETLTQGNCLTLNTLAKTLEHLAEAGLEDFYHGSIAEKLANDLEAAGSPIRVEDFESYRATEVTPLNVHTSTGTLYNLPAPTQGIASLIILALYDRIYKMGDGSETDMAHLLIEATKQAFIARNEYVTDPARLSINLQDLLSDANLATMTDKIAIDQAQAWPHAAKHGDTIWMGCCDSEGRMVSYIQSLFWEFGSGIVSPSTGIVWNNRGSSFSLEKGNLQELKPNLKPFHTLNPAFAELADGRRISYGTMGGEGQPQTQAALFSRYVYHKQPLDTSIAAGRWLLGRTWGDVSHNLKVESDFAADAAQSLIARGHDLVEVPACNELMGHAGAVVLFPEGNTDAAADPRSDGLAVSSTSHSG
ncbi:Putative gamma-glutamyltransferase YwrD [Marinomonas gallaica]|uniref:Gamma-glutamyltransferase YwrD n=1 Tax=Marinomonas gallaica TaxID=1806667 RepID=A0A1C3JR67_9GAMM|nr:gamma-glutamyltransferase [Marinomonas gallaica]SBT17597.1 Putative gamma-glutamyltransferase YwrD [Marinomonas gallaica]SBT19923.1 Putative gamma-glutamyltransferase YwrD [Marinomonas gallaica]